MRQLIRVLAFIASVGTPTLCLGATQWVYLAAGGKITVFQVEESTGELSRLQEIHLSGAGPLTASPDQRYLYAIASRREAGKRRPQPAIATFSVADSGRLKRVEIAPATMRAGYLKSDATGRFLAGNHYGPGTVSVWKLIEGVYRGETAQELTLALALRKSDPLLLS